MRKVMLCALIMCRATAFFSGPACPRFQRCGAGHKVAIYQFRDHQTLRRDASGGDEDTDADGPASAEAGEVEISDAEVEELVRAIEHGSSRNTSRGGAARRGDMDEMKMIMLLRQQMGEEDFYTVFDPRNPRIGDV